MNSTTLLVNQPTISFETFEDIASLTELHRVIMVEGVKFKACSNTHNSIALFFENGKTWFRYDLMVHDNENLKLWEEKNLPREIKLQINLSFKVI